MEEERRVVLVAIEDACLELDVVFLLHQRCTQHVQALLVDVRRLEGGAQVGSEAEPNLAGGQVEPSHILQSRERGALLRLHQRFTFYACASESAGLALPLRPHRFLQPVPAFLLQRRI